jgi:hypothetical protein
MTFQQYPQKGGIPSGSTAGRPSGAVEGDTYYNGELGLLEIYSDGLWIPCSAPAGIPTVVGTDVGTSRAYGSGAISITFTPGTNGGTPYGYVGTAVIGATTYTTGATTATTVTLVVGDSGTYSVSGVAYNGFGTSPSSVPSGVAVTTVPQAPSSVTASTSAATANVAVNWTIGANGGKVLTGQTITAYAGTSAVTSTTVSTSATSATVTGLTDDTTYTFKVFATNANGNSLDSTASNSVTTPDSFTLDWLVIAGGGGPGTGGITGGGGAGGYRTSAGTSGGGAAAESALSFWTGSNLTLTVGAGASGAANGNNSSIAATGITTITSTGGGRGGRNGGNNGQTGGSGGGAYALGSVGAGTTNQGYAGGLGVSNENSGGGGGAGAVGVNATTSVAGAGGDGVSSSITGTAVTRAGGGGGSAYNATVGAGGAGGGGSGNNFPSNSPAGTSGAANTGGGAGGSNAQTNGGSGVIILRYPDTRTITIGAGLTGTESSASGGYKRATITGGTGNVSWS